MKKKITFIKLGGSVITHKTIQGKLRKHVLQALVAELASFYQELPADQTLVVGHGAGSFAHVPAAQYKTKEGFIREDSKFGMASVLDSVSQLNTQVISEFLEHDVPAVSIRMSQSVMLDDHQPSSVWLEPFEFLLAQNLLPVVFGDVLFDQKRGCGIWSTEQVFSFLVTQLHDHPDYEVARIIHVAEVPGLLDSHNQVIPEVSEQTWPELQHHLFATKGYDATGGMKLKIEESLSLAKNGIESLIISGLGKGTLQTALAGQVEVGTRIR